MMRITDTVKHLLIINVIFYVGCVIIGKGAYELFSLYFPLSPQFKFWQPVTYMFMHDATSIRHLFSNMLLLFFVGPALEDIWGSKKFIFFYFSCGLGAALLHLGIEYISFYNGLATLVDAGFAKADVLKLLAEGKYMPGWEEYLTPMQFSNFMQAYLVPMLGASGAVYGLLIAYAFLFPNREIFLFLIPIPIKVKYVVGVTILSDLYLGFRGTSLFGGNSDGIAHFAHIGGALIGFIMMWYWKKNEHNNRRWN